MLDGSGKERSLTEGLTVLNTKVPFLQSAELKAAQYSGFSCTLIYKWVKPSSERFLSLSDCSHHECKFSCVIVYQWSYSDLHETTISIEPNGGVGLFLYFGLHFKLGDAT